MLNSNIYAALFPHLSQDAGSPPISPMGGETAPMAPQIAPPRDNSWIPIPPQTAEQPIGDTVADDTVPTANPVQVEPRTQHPDFSNMPMPTQAQPQMSFNVNDAPIQRPDFQLPYENPQNHNEEMRNALALGQYDAMHPQNRDHGVKGFLKELLQNFGTGMAQTPQGASWKQALLLGAAGAGTGAVNRSWNDERDAQEKLPMLQKAAEMAGQDEYRQQQTEHQKAQDKIDADVAAGRLTAEQARLLTQQNAAAESKRRYEAGQHEAHRKIIAANAVKRTTESSAVKAIQDEIAALTAQKKQADGAFDKVKGNPKSKDYTRLQHKKDALETKLTQRASDLTKAQGRLGAIVDPKWEDVDPNSAPDTPQAKGTPYKGLTFTIDAIPQIKAKHPEYKNMKDEDIIALIESGGGTFQE